MAMFSITNINLATLDGIEPPSTEYESAVLPLNYGSRCRSFPAVIVCMPRFWKHDTPAFAQSGLGGARSGLPTPSGFPTTTVFAVTLSLAVSTEEWCTRWDLNPHLTIISRRL